MHASRVISLQSVAPLSCHNSGDDEGCPVLPLTASVPSRMGSLAPCKQAIQGQARSVQGQQL